MNYTPYHIHSDLSLIDSTTKFITYLDKAKEYDIKAFAFSEHGSVFNWVKKKQECEKRGIKYIHAQEFYVTESLNEKVRDNYHVILIARNWEGVKELNYLSSLAYNKNDGHFYYDPRITIDELINTSDNIIITTACLAGILSKGKGKEIEKKFIYFLKTNKHRCFLEIQYHNIKEQIEYNQYLYQLSQQINVPLITGTDTHALNQEHAKTRLILQKAKNIKYENEEKLDLTFKNYNELIEMFEIQNSLPKDIILKAIDNTNLIAEMVEEFQLDTSHKYPKLYNNPEKVFKEKIRQGIKKRNIKMTPEYKERIMQEYEVYKNLGAIDYMLFEEDIITWCKERNIYTGYGRGSVNGSLIAYILGITDMDSIKWKLNFFRFMNPERVSLADIDIDFPPSRRAEVIKYIAEKPNIYFAEIVTFNTIALKGAIREVGRALEMELSIIDEIAKNIESNEEKYRQQYPELFKYVDLLNGVNVSVGSHPSGFVTSPIALEDNMGTFYTAESKYPVTQINMKEIDSLNFVKLDILGLANIEIINETCRLAGIERITPDNLNTNDIAVWESIRESPLGIFQFENEFSHKILSKMLSKEVVEKIKKQNPDFSYIDLMSMTNGAIRPAGESYRDLMAQGIFRDNGHPALNEFLKDTMGYLIYQEQIMMFLVEFCGFSMAESDTVRRGFAKKTGTEQFLPKIKEGFLKTMNSKYGVKNDEAEKLLESFLKVIEDASDYGFSLNHSQPYSLIGYACGYLRHYYPLQFLTAMLNTNVNKIDKTAEIIKYANSKGIIIKAIKFRKSRFNYSYSKEENAIYKGLESIKHLNAEIAEQLYALKHNQYDSFLDLLIDIKTKTSCNSRQLDILIKLNFFSEFGKNKKLLNFVQLFSDLYGLKQIKKDKVDKFKLSHDMIKQFARETEKSYMDFDSTAFLKYMWEQLEDKSLSVLEQIQAEKEFLGYISTIYSNIDSNYRLITEVNTKYTPKITTYCFTDGTEQTYKIYKKTFNKNSLKEGDVIRISKSQEKPKPIKLDNGEWGEHPTEKEWVLLNYAKININNKK